MTDTLKLIMCCLSWYSCSAFTNNSGKMILSTYQHPITLTTIQFFSVCFFSWFGARLNVSPNILKLDKRIFLYCAPLSIFQVCGHVLSSIALSYVSVSFSHSIKALAPLFTVFAYRTIFNTVYPSKIYFSLIPLTSGVILTCLNKISFNWIGFSCSLIATVIFVMQNIFSKTIFEEILNSASLLHISNSEKIPKSLKQISHSTSEFIKPIEEFNDKKLDKINVLFYSSMFASLLMMPFWFYNDSRDFMESPPSFFVLQLYLFNSITHFTQNLLALTVLTWVSPISYSIASLVKRIVVITASILFFRDPVSFYQGFGIVLTFYGLWLYDQSSLDENTKKIQMTPNNSLPTHRNID